MAEIRSIDMKNNEIIINLRISRQEYDILKQNTDNLILLPSDRGTLNQTLTTGKLGNSNRLMLPKKLLDKEGVKILHKKVPARMFKTNGEVLLLVKLEEFREGIPTFKEDGE